MDKTKLTLLIGLSLAVFACRKDSSFEPDCTEENIWVTQHQDTQNWFWAVANLDTFITAKTPDGLTEQFDFKSETNYYKYMFVDCNKREGIASKEISYLGQLYGEEINLNVWYFMHPDFHVEIEMKTLNSNAYNYHGYDYFFNKPNKLFRWNKDLGADARFVGDTTISGNTFDDIYIFALPDTSSVEDVGPLETAIFSRTYGLLVVKNRTSTNLWVFDPLFY